MATPHDAGVGKLDAEVVLAQVGVGVEMEDAKLGVALDGGAHRPQSDEMFAAQEERDLARVEDAPGFGLDLR